jgi:hypothetical protein
MLSRDWFVFCTSHEIFVFTHYGPKKEVRIKDVRLAVSSVPVRYVNPSCVLKTVKAMEQVARKTLDHAAGVLNIGDCVNLAQVLKSQAMLISLIIDVGSALPMYI